jgi:hypothetical protein
MWYSEPNAISNAVGYARFYSRSHDAVIQGCWCRLGVWSLELDVDFDAAQAPLEVSKHFMSAICSLINSPSKLCRVDGRVAKWTFSILSLEPVDSFLDQLATFRAGNFQR